jgi:HSP20 family protein
MILVRYSYPSYRTLTPSFAAAARSQWSGLETEIDRLFETALRDFAGTSASGRFPVDLYEDTENTYVRAELPGFNRDDINVELAEGFLTLTANRKQGENAEAFSFTRSVTVGDQVDPTKVAAAYENGVLTVTLPKREEAKPKKITVAVK